MIVVMIAGDWSNSSGLLLASAAASASPPTVNVCARAAGDGAPGRSNSMGPGFVFTPLWRSSSAGSGGAEAADHADLRSLRTVGAASVRWFQERAGSLPAPSGAVLL